MPSTPSLRWSDSPAPSPVAAEYAASDDDALIAGLLADREAAWREFNVRYSRLLYRCITRITGRFGGLLGPDDVREIYTNLCLQLLANDKHKLRSFEPGRGNRFGSWIGMLAIHTTYDYLRQLKREPMRTGLHEAEQLCSSLPDPQESCELRERATWITSVLASFSAKDRQFVSLYYGEGLEPEDVAQRLGISVKTVYSKKHKIESRLEALVAQRKLAA
jgi:RNA polymerase sigma-70 factor, ECF subfamily